MNMSGRFCFPKIWLAHSFFLHIKLLCINKLCNRRAKRRRLLLDTKKTRLAMARVNKEKTDNVHTCKGLWRCCNKNSRPGLRCKSPYHQLPITRCHVSMRVHVYSRLCFITRLDPSLSQAHALWQVRKLGDSLRHSPMHYWTAVTERIRIGT